MSRGWFWTPQGLASMVKEPTDEMVRAGMIGYDSIKTATLYERIRCVYFAMQEVSDTSFESFMERRFTEHMDKYES